MCSSVYPFVVYVIEQTPPRTKEEPY
jgi:hypothetical protein